MKVPRPALWTVTLAMVVAGIGVVTAVIPFRHIIDQQRRVTAAVAELETLQEENELLEREVEALNSPQEIERLARERLGYVMPGEVPYVVVEPPEGATTTTSYQAPVVTPPEQVPWYQDIWEFFTGADLVDG
ncbi:MAG TPA: septum formation initiator family protein [Acidimicrobiia bacterium]|nr:septum formation initiator family protein [Acidimicrobiia bacterium]